MTELTTTEGPINITIGQSWCHFSKEQAKANAKKDNVQTFMCGDDDDDKDTLECKQLGEKLPAFPANFQCTMEGGELKCEAPKLGYDKEFGSTE